MNLHRYCYTSLTTLSCSANPLLWAFIGAGGVSAKCLGDWIVKNKIPLAQELQNQNDLRILPQVAANGNKECYLVPPNGGKFETLTFIALPNMHQVEVGNLLPQLKYTYE